jgi:hypothetical protein
MRSLYNSLISRTHFPPPSANTSIIVSFNAMLSTLTANKTSNVAVLNNYKETVSKFNNVFVKDIVSAVESLLSFFINPPNNSYAISSFTIKSNVPLTIDPLYLKYLKGEEVDITDPVVLSILKEIKSKNII